MMRKLNDFASLEILKQEKTVKKEAEKVVVAERKSYFEKDYFSTVKYEDPSSSFTTQFTDAQVIRIIEKASNINVRRLAWEFQRIYHQNVDRAFMLRYILHTICNKLVSRYGSPMLSFIHDLNIQKRPDENFLPFPNLSEFTIDSQEPDFDTIKITKGWQTKYIGFEVSEYNSKPYMIVCDSSRYLQGRINELGYVEDDFINRMRFNIFEFLEGGECSYYGSIVNCKCSKCKKELTNPESIYFGMGPVCRGDIYRW